VIVVDVDPWRAQFGGARIADVYHQSHSTPVAAFEVDGWDWSTSTTTATRADVERGLHEWIDESGETYLAELAYLNKT
jgi:hypothetical protein